MQSDSVQILQSEHPSLWQRVLDSALLTRKAPQGIPHVLLEAHSQHFMERQGA